MVDDLAEVSVRPAVVEDAPEISRVHIESWREAYAGVVPEDYLAGLDVDARAARWSEILRDPESGIRVWVAQHEDGRVVGFASLGPSRDEDADRRTMEIYTIYLEPAAWGHGVARRLMRTLLAETPAGASVTLWALASNERAAHFYRRNGFVPDGVERVEQIGGEPLTEIRYRRD